MLVVTMVDTITGSTGIRLVAVRSRRMYSAISMPDMLPVKGMYSPVLESFA